MKKLLIILYFLFLTACTPIQSMLDSTVIVTGYSNGVFVSQGSGVVTEHGILTAGHVVRNTDTIKVEYRDGSKEEVTLEKIHMEHRGNTITYDIALLNNNSSKHLQQKIQCNPVNIQDEVFVVGHPHNMSWVMTRGRITSIHPRTNQKENTWIHTDAVFTRGSSGGPVFSKSGQIIGIISHMDMMQTQRSFVPSGFGFAVSGKEICKFLGIKEERKPHL